MIHISLVDPALDLVPSQPADLTLSKPADYLRGYDSIARAIHDGRNLRVLVQDRTVGKWLTVMARKYGRSVIELEELTLRKQVAKQIGIDVPDTVTDQQIVESRLLDLNIPAGSQASFEDYILEVFFGSFLTQPGGLRRVGEFAPSLDVEQWRAAMNRPLVQQIFHRRITYLHSQLSREGKMAEQQILEWLAESPERLIRNLVALKVLAAYPQKLGIRVVGKYYPDLVRLNLDLRHIPIKVGANQLVVDELRIYLETLTDDPDTDRLTELLDQASGWLEIEIEAVLQLLGSGNVPITESLVRHIQAKFRHLTTVPRLGQVLADLDLLVSKTPPSKPDPNWHAAEWIRWAEEEYLPYRFWLENTDRLDDAIGEIANTYADWLHANYGYLLYHSEYMAWRSLKSLHSTMKEHDGPVLVVMIDNLNTKFYPDLRMQMQHQGYLEQSMELRISNLPSCTEVCKKAILGAHYAPFPDSGYKICVEETWAGLTDRRVLYVPHIGEFRAIKERNHDIYFLNYLPVDITLHQSENETGVSHAQTIRDFLASLSQDIRIFAERLDAERSLLVIFIADHGSTRIPKGTVNVIESNAKGFYRKRALDEHHRYLAISDHEFGNLPSHSKFDCYSFDHNQYELGKNYLVARRLYRFLPTDDHAYIHGGLTPEETLVPLAVFQRLTVTPRPLSVATVGKNQIVVGGKSEFMIEVTNLNSYPCEEMIVELADPNISAEPITLNTLTQLNRIQVDFTARCRRNADPSVRKIQARLAYRFLGQPYVQKVEFPIDIVEPATTKFDLDDL